MLMTFINDLWLILDLRLLDKLLRSVLESCLTVEISQN